MAKRIILAAIVPLLTIGSIGAATLSASGDDGCCCVVNDAGKLVCAKTGQVLETCCCK